MDCGIPFCHTGCPVEQSDPRLERPRHRGTSGARRSTGCIATNNFPEFTGRVCPAPCEAACTLNLDDAPVTIKTIECEIVDRGWREGWIEPHMAPRGTGKRIAIVGSGPAGLACAQQLARMGHAPTVFEKADRIGGLLRYGIPDFKMDQTLIDRRIEQMEVEGRHLPHQHGGRRHRPGRAADGRLSACSSSPAAPSSRATSTCPGRELGGIHFAMDYLVQQNRRNAGDCRDAAAQPILATGKHVVVIGGGDTGSDCIGTANRQGAASVTQLEILPEPPLARGQGAELAALADEAAHLLLAGGRRGARVLGR